MREVWTTEVHKEYWPGENLPRTIMGPTHYKASAGDDEGDDDFVPVEHIPGPDSTLCEPPEGMLQGRPTIGFTNKLKEDKVTTHLVNSWESETTLCGKVAAHRSINTDPDDIGCSECRDKAHSALDDEQADVIQSLNYTIEALRKSEAYPGEQSGQIHHLESLKYQFTRTVANPAATTDGAESGTCDLCGQVMYRTAEDCWHPHDVKMACPPEPDMWDNDSWVRREDAGVSTGRPGRQHWRKPRENLLKHQFKISHVDASDQHTQMDSVWFACRHCEAAIQFERWKLMELWKDVEQMASIFKSETFPPCSANSRTAREYYERQMSGSRY